MIRSAFCTMYPNLNSRALGLDLPAKETLERASEAGFEGVDLMVRDIVEDGGDLRELRARMDDLGLRGGAWPLPVAWRADGERFAHDLGRLPRLAEAAAVLGLTRTGTWVMPETPERPESETARADHLAAIGGLHLQRLGAIARVLAEHGCRLGLEVIGVASFRTGRGWPFVTRLAELDRWLGTLWDEAPNLGILLDGFHLFAAGETIEAGLMWGVDRVFGVHLADLPAEATPDRGSIRDDDRGLPGENGAIDSQSLLQRLAEEGYDGPVTVEPLGGCRSLAGLTAESAICKAASALRASLAGGDPSLSPGLGIPLTQQRRNSRR